MTLKELQNEKKNILKKINELKQQEVKRVQIFIKKLNLEHLEKDFTEVLVENKKDKLIIIYDRHKHLLNFRMK